MKIHVATLPNFKGSLPDHGSHEAAAVDLCAAIDTTTIVAPSSIFQSPVDNLIVGHIAVIPTGIAVAIPKGYVGRIWSRSGLAAKFGIQALGGVIDSDYRGEIKVILHVPHGPFEIKPGDRIAQLAVIKHELIEWECISHDELMTFTTERGTSGFGSTGV